LLPGRGARIRLLGPDGKIRFFSRATLARAFTAGRLDGARREAEAVLGPQPMGKARERAVARLIERRMGDAPMGRMLMLREAGTPSPQAVPVLCAIGGLFGLLILAYALEAAGWRLIGGVTLGGRLDTGWLAGWALMLASLAPLHALCGYVQQALALKGGLFLKRRALFGALELEPDRLRGEGAGRLLGQVMEAQTLETLALSGGAGLLTGLVALAAAFLVLLWGAGGLLQAGALLAFSLFTLGLGLNAAARVSDWTDRRMKASERLIEKMLGRRTRMAQEPEARRLAEEDGELGEQLAVSRRMDQASTLLLGATPTLWLILALASLAPALVFGKPDAPHLATALGGVILAGRGLTSLVEGLGLALRARDAFTRTATLFQIAPAEGPRLPPAVARAASRALAKAPALEARSLSITRRAGTEPVLADVNLSLEPDEKVLIEGESGGGKSSLASALSGLRSGYDGQVSINGLDQKAFGGAWSELVCHAPQFHDNHIIAGPLGLNLLLGTGWPASEAERARALSVCEDLGLGPLIRRMPGGLDQRVGESGWLLSHGEQSRIFLARALLQAAPVTILDETFAALDPEVQAQCVEAARRRSRTLLVIAHP
jgi:ATP-binding cassette subfamily B protein